jgi:16S rRNA (cytidine1402-2'-O)-methyltransferase
MNTQSSFNNKNHTLFLVCTPIGNLQDMTLRAIETLKNSSYIFCEDTRVSKVLLTKYQIETKVKRFNYHDQGSLDEILSSLKLGDISFISDAGMPSISDPGYELVSLVRQNNYNCVVIGGISATLTSLVASGLSPMPFAFLGFLPRKKNEAKQLLLPYTHLNISLIIYESPNRINDTITNLASLFPSNNYFIARELTKVYETFYYGNFDDDTLWNLPLLGEYTIVIEVKQSGEKFQHLSIKDHVNHYLDLGYTISQALLSVSKDLNKNKSEIYSLYHNIKKKE